MAQQFTQMILAQRGYQANSKTITVSDEAAARHAEPQAVIDDGASGRHHRGAGDSAGPSAERTLPAGRTPAAGRRATRSRRWWTSPSGARPIATMTCQRPALRRPMPSRRRCRRSGRGMDDTGDTPVETPVVVAPVWVTHAGARGGCGRSLGGVTLETVAGDGAGGSSTASVDEGSKAGATVPTGAQADRGRDRQRQEGDPVAFEPAAQRLGGTRSGRRVRATAPASPLAARDVTPPKAEPARDHGNGDRRAGTATRAPHALRSGPAVVAGTPTDSEPPPSFQWARTTQHGPRTECRRHEHGVRTAAGRRNGAGPAETPAKAAGARPAAGRRRHATARRRHHRESNEVSGRGCCAVRVSPPHLSPHPPVAPADAATGPAWREDAPVQERPRSTARLAGAVAARAEGYRRPGPCRRPESQSFEATDRRAPRPMPSPGRSASWVSAGRRRG